MVAKNRQNNDLLLKFQKDQKMRGFGHMKGLFKILRASGKRESCPLAFLAGGKDRKRIILKKKICRCSFVSGGESLWNPHENQSFWENCFSLNTARLD